MLNGELWLDHVGWVASPCEEAIGESGKRTSERIGIWGRTPVRKGETLDLRRDAFEISF